MPDQFEKERQDGFVAVVGSARKRESDWERTCLRERRPFICLRTDGVTSHVRYRLDTMTGDEWEPCFNQAVQSWLRVEESLLLQGSPHSKATCDLLNLRPSAHYIDPEHAKVFVRSLAMLVADPSHYDQATLSFSPARSITHSVDFGWAKGLKWRPAPLLMDFPPTTGSNLR